MKHRINTKNISKLMKLFDLLALNDDVQAEENHQTDDGDGEIQSTIMAALPMKINAIENDPRD
ncbi:hypothetical protein QR98_0003360 [Sarcoptes scabiei]|uniref:Uncharacterized protein n=1 Tax=Sarcoptes scabiei TaxID=52283 RepID=A0A131ZT68_SARSC|nr:hypothetical protein QR98_0003360 [Sarcoptes scabiei]